MAHNFVNIIFEDGVIRLDDAKGQQPVPEGTEILVVNEVNIINKGDLT